MKIILTGTAGFIAHFVALRLLKEGHEVVGIDNVNPYYDVKLKEARIKNLNNFPNFIEARIDLEDKDAVAKIF